MCKERNNRQPLTVTLDRNKLYHKENLCLDLDGNEKQVDIIVIPSLNFEYYSIFEINQIYIYKTIVY